MAAFLSWLQSQGPWATLAAAALGAAGYFYRRYETLMERHLMKGENWAEKGLAQAAKLNELLAVIADQQRRIIEVQERRAPRNKG